MAGKPQMNSTLCCPKERLHYFGTWDEVHAGKECACKAHYLDGQLRPLAWIDARPSGRCGVCGVVVDDHPHIKCGVPV